jgi:hypothetical protein
LQAIAAMRDAVLAQACGECGIAEACAAAG